MAFCFPTDQLETTVLREVFGPRVCEVVLYDAESGGGRFVEAIGTDAAGHPLHTVSDTDPDMARLEELAAGRGLTVKFWFLVPAGD